MSADTSGLVRILDALQSHEDELRDLDAATGDGDLGVTVRSTCQAALVWLHEQPRDPSWSEILRGLAAVASATNPSTFASLISRGLMAAAKRLDSDIDADAAVLFEVAVDMIRKRGGAGPGEKTFVDALVPALETLKAAPDDPRVVSMMRTAAVQGTEDSIPARPQHGRAAWLGERAEGKPDAGSVVVIRALEALAEDGTKAWVMPA